jgi:hypothetical protein
VSGAHPKILAAVLLFILKSLANGGANLLIALLWGGGENSENDSSLTVDNNVGGHTQHIKKGECFSVEPYAVEHLPPAHSHGPDHPVEFAAIRVGGDADDHQTTTAKRGIEVSKKRDFVDAWGTGGRPKIQEHYFPSQIHETQKLAVCCFRRERGNDLAEIQRVDFEEQPTGTFLRSIHRAGASTWPAYGLS